jgi:hypothetical protein
MADDEERARARLLATVLDLAKKDPARYDFRSLLYGRADIVRNVIEARLKIRLSPEA